MPQNGLNYEGRRRRARGDTCDANGHVPGAALVNGAVVHNGCPAAATRIGASAPAGAPTGTEAQCMVNGYINSGYKGRSKKAPPPPPPRTLRKQGSRISAVTDASAAGSSTAFPGGISVNGPTSPDTTTTTAAAAGPCNSDQTAPEPSPSAPARNQRRWKRIRHKRPVGTPPPPMMPPQEENWESEIQEVTLTDWEKENFGSGPYGPEDVIHYSLRDLTLTKQRDTPPDLPVTADYRPVVHHRIPLRWSSYSLPTEPEQFADADE
uniref:Uncharacterized protein n=1 Tax=Larimichthys crocea TaxID=215358 RepID=A0A0F8CEK4_LARCR